MIARVHTRVTSCGPSSIGASSSDMFVLRTATIPWERGASGRDVFCVDLVEDRAEVLLDLLALDLQRGRELAVGDGERARERLPLPDPFDAGELLVAAVDA